jgi:GGDEF domain-containing protein
VGQLTSGWTEQRLAVAAALLAAALTGGLAMLASPPYGVIGIGVVAAVVIAALLADAFGGIIAGFVGAAVVIAARQLGDAWTSEDFRLAGSLSAALVLLGWLTGVAATRLRERAPQAGPGPVAPAFGSLGLLPTDLALARLDEEITRAVRHHRPLCVALLVLEITDDTLSPSARTAACRTVARLVESLMPETAVPFALAPDEVGAILLEADEARAWELLGPVVDAASRATFTVRDVDQRRPLADGAELHAGLVALSSDHPDAERLLAAARRAADRDRPAGPAHPVRDARSR